MASPIDSVLLIGFGGPTRPDEVHAFLQNVVRGRDVPPERLEEAARHYQEIGGRSPYNDWSFRQAEALRARLEAEGLPLPVYVGMRNWHPCLVDTVAEMNRAGCHRPAGVILAPHRSQTSWERYHLDVERAREAAGGRLEVHYLRPWHADPLFLEAIAARVEEATGRRRGGWPPELRLLFTAHSIPISMAQTSHYVEEVRETAAGVARVIGAPRWSVAYQSRSGDPRTPWLEPDVNDSLRAAAAEGVTEAVLVPAGFLCDHVEVLYDLDIEARRTAQQVGIHLARAGTVGDQPAFIDLLAGRVREVAEARAP